MTTAPSVSNAQRPPSPLANLFYSASPARSPAVQTADPNIVDHDVDDGGMAIATAPRTRSTIERAAAALLRMSPSRRQNSRPASPVHQAAAKSTAPTNPSPAANVTPTKTLSKSGSGRGMMGWFSGSSKSRSSSPARHAPPVAQQQQQQHGAYPSSSSRSTYGREVTYTNAAYDTVEQKRSVAGLFRMRPNSPPHQAPLPVPVPMSEEEAAIIIQSGFRGYLVWGRPF